MRGDTELRSVPAARLRLTWGEGEWRLEKVHPVGEMRLLPSRPLPTRSGGGGHAGFWIELLDGDGKVLYRRILQDPTEPTVEVFDRGRPHRLPFRRSRALLDLPVPDLPETETVRIWGQVKTQGERLPGSVELASLPLDRIRDKEG